MSTSPLCEQVADWEHNSHIGDARATSMRDMGEWNLGQLARERFGGDVVLVGFKHLQRDRHRGIRLGRARERKRVRPGLQGSFEALFHAVGTSDFLLDLRAGSPASHALEEIRLERAIGVIISRELSGSATTSRLACRSSLMRYFTSTSPRRSSRSTAAPGGTWAIRPTLSPPDSETD